MEDNDSMEGKKIELEMFEQKVLEAIKIAEKQKIDTAVINNGQYPLEITIVKEENETKIHVFGEEILTLDEEENFNYNIGGLTNIQKKLEDNPNLDYEQLGLPDVEYLQEVQHKKGEKQRDEIDLSDDIKDEEEQEEEKSEEDNETEKDEESEEIEDPKIQEIAKQLDVNPKDVVHLDTKNEKLTTDENFSELVKWAEGRSSVYVVANKLGTIEKVVEKTENGYEEVEHDMNQMHGDYPNVDIHLVGDDKIEKVVPLKIYQIDSKTAFATIRNNWGELETIYCRKQEGEEKYWGSKVPESSGKNVKQMEYDERELMSPKYNSSLDLDDKAEEFSKAEELNDRGVPSGEDGVQANEIKGDSTQNYELRKEEIKEDLYRRKGLAEKMKGAMPGLADYLDKKIDKQAEKILELMEENKDMTYEQAIEETDKEEQTREEGGITRGEKRNEM